jgi:hypothetical protein
MNPFEFYSILLWDIVEPAGFVLIVWLLYKTYKELRLIRELLENDAHGGAYG